ncbi:MAG: hypothetical protein R8N23_08780 [Reichenbachiella sp.]|uniref:hypothetical protein n=1 Tax=Reichenbachiella sp. TaxID=2184521 RepID=UPI0029663A40|nr:hypothetical protein [Reichenbachiella sp.]MDW3209948.1 hypothetical protein [Reichenbachiella sp.]
MKKFRVTLGIGAACVLIGHITVLNYNDLSWSQNTGQYLGIIAMIGLIIAMVFSKNHSSQ